MSQHVACLTYHSMKLNCYKILLNATLIAFHFLPRCIKSLTHICLINNCHNKSYLLSLRLEDLLKSRREVSASNKTILLLICSYFEAVSCQSQPLLQQRPREKIRSSIMFKLHKDSLRSIPLQFLFHNFYLPLVRKFLFSPKLNWVIKSRK